MTKKEFILKLNAYIQVLQECLNIGTYNINSNNKNQIKKVCDKVARYNYDFIKNTPIKYTSIELSSLNIDIFHYFSIFEINDNNNTYKFLFDPTWGQFFGNEEYKEYMLKYYKDFSLKLLNNGYIEIQGNEYNIYKESFSKFYNKRSRH